MIYNLTILIHNREYTDYTLFELKTNRKITNEEIIKNIDPITKFNLKNNIKILKSILYINVQ